MSTIQDIIPIIEEKTASKKIKWDILGNDRVVTKIGDNIIEIQEDNPLDMYSFYIRNSQGESIDFETHLTRHETGAMLGSIYYIASRSARGVEEIIDFLKDELLRM